jgi:cob(I)alamin adenosyltransferase
MSIYTKTGDDGTTALYGGKRISKGDPKVEAYGSIDELTSFIGLVISHLSQKDLLRHFFITVQEDLMIIGGVLAGWTGDITPLEKQVEKMEAYMDTFGRRLPPLTTFILPGGTTKASYMHVARSVCRRAERTIVRLTQNHTQYATIAKYLNRLSDLFFIYARVLNKKAHKKELPWKGIQK